MKNYVYLECLIIFQMSLIDLENLGLIRSSPRIYMHLVLVLFLIKDYHLIIRFKHSRQTPLANPSAPLLKENLFLEKN